MTRIALTLIAMSIIAGLFLPSWRPDPLLIVSLAGIALGCIGLVRSKKFKAQLEATSALSLRVHGLAILVFTWFFGLMLQLRTSQFGDILVPMYIVGAGLILCSFLIKRNQPVKPR